MSLMPCKEVILLISCRQCKVVVSSLPQLRPSWRRQAGHQGRPSAHTYTRSALASCPFISQQWQWNDSGGAVTVSTQQGSSAYPGRQVVEAGFFHQGCFSRPGRGSHTGFFCFSDSGGNSFHSSDHFLLRLWVLGRPYIQHQLPLL